VNVNVVNVPLLIIHDAGGEETGVPLTVHEVSVSANPFPTTVILLPTGAKEG
jgi:hypothetical protein